MSSFKGSSIGQWGSQLKTTKREIQDFMIWELKGIKQNLRY